MDIIILIIIIVSLVRKTRKKSVKKRPSTVREMNRNTEILRQQQMRQQEMQRQQQMHQQEMQRQQQMRQQEMQRQQQMRQQEMQRQQQWQQLQQDGNKQRELKKRLEGKYGKVQKNKSILDRAMKHTTEETTDASGDVRMDKVYDLMITGYDGNLNFERDFLGEAMDMLNRNYVLTDLEVGDLTYSE